MHSFEIYGEWLVQTNKPTNQQAYTHVRNAVMLVLGLLRLAPTTSCIPTLGLRHDLTTATVTKPWVGGGRAGPPTWVTVTRLAVHYCRKNVHSNTKSVQLKDCIKQLKVYIIKCSDMLRLYLSNGVYYHQLPW